MSCENSDVTKGGGRDELSDAVLEPEIEKIRLRAHRMARAQYLQAKATRRWKNALGIPAVTLSAIAGTSTFAAASSSASTGVLIASGGISIVAAVLVALQTFLGLAERSEKHRSSAAAYAGKKRDLDLLKVSLRTGGSSDSVLSSLAKIVAEINALERDSLDVRDRDYDRARVEQSSDSEGV